MHVRDGRIVAIGPHEGAQATARLAALGDAAIVDVGSDVVMPGLVDTHVHVNEPGRTEWEGFATATRAAAAGGVTTLLDMPLNSIPATTSVAALDAKRTAARGQCWVDVGFLGGAVPGNAADLEPLHTAGVLGFKSFLVPSGVPEFENDRESDLREAMEVLATLDATVMVHCELPGPIIAATESLTGRDAASYATYLASRPSMAEVEAIALVCRLSRETGARVHIVHLSATEAIPLLAAERARGTRVTVETCPHYLYFAAEEIPDRATEYKCAPPVRSAANRELLWQGLAAGVIDQIVSDHSPCPPALKLPESGDFLRAWGGITSLQLGLSIVWSGARSRSVPIEKVAEWMCTAPARLAGLSQRKGAIAVGLDADFVVWAPEEEFIVTANHLEQRYPVTPYLGARLPGVVRTTYLRGERTYENGALTPTARGSLLRRTS